MPGPDFDLETFLALPRLAGLHLSPDGSRLALTIQEVAASGQRFTSAVWELRTDGGAAPRRLTRSDAGEIARGFLPDGSLLFTSARPSEPGGAGVEADALYVLPASGGEPRRVLGPDGGVRRVVTTPSSATVAVTVPVHPGAVTLADDAERQRARAEAGVEARLVEHYPDRYWDHDIGPRAQRVLAAELEGEAGDAEPAWRDLTPAPPWPGWLEPEGLDMALSPDGSRLAFGAATRPGPRLTFELAIVPSSAEEAVRVLVGGDVDHGAMAWSPDGTTLAVASSDIGAPDAPPHSHLSLVDAATGAIRELVPGWDASVHEVRWASDGTALLVTADERGHVPVFRVGLDGSLTRLTAAGAHTSLAVGSGGDVYAIRSQVDAVPAPVRLDQVTPDQDPAPLPFPPCEVDVPVRLEEVTATAADGTAVHSWLVLPVAAPQPLPLAVLIHGGPLSAWSGWHWRWSAPLLAARGWAVLLPNPRLSTGYGHDHIAAAWNDWATLPAADIHAALDAAAARPDVDGDRAAALGGSYGGYMANWLAGTSDRFSAIVTHASVWNLFMERQTSDVGFYMDREFGDPLRHEERWRQQSPHRNAAAISTPMLVIHGARDQRVPIDNAHHLWMELQVRGIPSRLLTFPDENHWVLKPQNARLWYQAVFAFLDEHVLGRDWVRPPLL